MEKFFITSIGTGIGKTLVTTTMCRQLRASGKKVIALKPVISGYDSTDKGSDSALILQSLGLEFTPKNIEKISPFRFAAPLSPDMAAAREGRGIGFNEVVSYCKAYEQAEADMLLAEGVGGVMVPLNKDYTVLDWMEALGWKIILISGSYLGAISHTLTACESLATHGLKPFALIISESESSEVVPTDMVGTLRNFLPEDVTIITIPRQNDKQGGKEMWELMPSLSEIWV
jgi:dethiobiotin synthetase